MDKLWVYKSQECKHDDSCLQSIVNKFIRLFGMASAIKFLLRLIAERNLTRILKTWTDVARFGLAIGLVSTLFRLTKCLFKYHQLRLKPDIETFIAAAVSSLGMTLTTQKEFTLITILIYPKVIEVGLRLLQEKGYIQNFKYSETLAFIICSMIIVYCYVFEPMNLDPNYVKGINSFAMLTQGEATIFATVTEQVTRNVNQYYHGIKPPI